MAQTFTKIPLSGSTDGRNIKVVATATAGTTIHTATSSTGSDSIDEVYIWANSTSTSAISLTIQTTSSPGDEGESWNARVPSAYNGPILVMPGFSFRNGVVITATASTANRVNLSGFVNRISGQSS